MITLTTRQYITHKEAETRDDCQDAQYENTKLGRFAIADGATRSFFPKMWAELLVKHFCNTPFFSFEEKNWKEWLGPLQQEWYERVEEKVKDRNLFYLTNSLNTKDAAVSTFIGVEIDRNKGRWQAMIIGDSCLFHKIDSGFKSYPIKKSEDFTSFPQVFASYVDKNHYDPNFISGEIQSGDMLILATDALAKWILEHNESGNLDTILERLKQINSDEQFNQFVDQARDEDVRLVNDDVTLMLISVEESKSSEIRESGIEVCSETHTPEEVESSVNVLEVVIWGLLAGVVGIWTFRWVFRFFRELIRALFNKN